MAANLNVTYDDMNKAAKDLETGKADIESKLAQLKKLVGSLVTSGFVTTSASGAFDKSYEEFNKGAIQVIGGLDGMSGFLKSAAKALGDTDEQLAKALKG